MSAPYTPAEVGRLWFEKVWNDRDSTMIPELMAPDGIGYTEGDQKITGIGAFLEYRNQFLTAMPDLDIEIVDSLADDHAVCVHWHATGTHTGAGLGLDPTGQLVSFRGVTWFKVKDGKLTEGRDFWNMDGLMNTLAAGPPGVEQ